MEKEEENGPTKDGLCGGREMCQRALATGVSVPVAPRERP